ncbi:MAG: hypothetical protein WA814_03020 [Candidatus Baltobacteraceae bacterium]
MHRSLAFGIAFLLVACTHNDFTPNVIQLNPSGTSGSPANQSIANSFTLTAVEDGYTGQFTAETTIGECWVVLGPLWTGGAWVVTPQGSTCASNLDTEKIVVKDQKGNSAVTYIRSTKSKGDSPGSRLRASAKSGDLLYVANNSGNAIDVYTYPEGAPAGTLTGFTSPTGLCADRSGNIWVVNQGSSGGGDLIEYAHGGTTPIATLGIPGRWGYGCAVDPSTGNLAVTSGNNEVSVFTAAQGAPTTYTDPAISSLRYCGYDNAGRLFLTGISDSGYSRLVELSGGTFSNVSLNVAILFSGAVQWDGKYLAVEQGPYRARVPVTIYRLKIAGGRGTVKATVSLSSDKNSPSPYPQFWIAGGTIVQATDHEREIAIWNYPSGGSPEKVIQRAGGLYLWGTAVSVAPHG